MINEDITPEGRIRLEMNIIGGLRMTITGAIQKFKDLNFDLMDDKYFLQLTESALIECLITCRFVLVNDEKILSVHKKMQLGAFDD